MNMKVNIYYSGFKHRAGGAYFHVENIVKGLEELGYNVKIITLDSLPFLIRYLPHISLKIGNIFNFPFGFLYKQQLIKFFYKILYKNSADIEIFEDIYTYWKSNKQSIVVLHALWSDNLQAYTITEKQRVQLEEEEARIINNIDVNVVTVSEPYKEFLLSRLKSSLLKNKINVIELGVDINKFSIGYNKNKSMIFVGSLEERKNIKFLLKVFRKIKSIDNYSLTIIGDGPQKKDLINYVKKYNIEDIFFLGRLDYDDVIKELPKHQYYIHTSTKESFSYSLLEAKLSGLITVAYNGLEVPEEFIDIKIENFDVDEWVYAINNFRNQESIFQSNQFSYQIMTKKTLEGIYKC